MEKLTQELKNQELNYYKDCIAKGDEVELMEHFIQTFDSGDCGEMNCGCDVSLHFECKECGLQWNTCGDMPGCVCGWEPSMAEVRAKQQEMAM